MGGQSKTYQKVIEMFWGMKAGQVSYASYKKALEDHRKAQGQSPKKEVEDDEQRRESLVEASDGREGEMDCRAESPPRT